MSGIKIRIKKCKRIKLPSIPNTPVSGGIFDQTFDNTFQ